ncbi:MAG TPA: sensor histidine kinase [Steroidobacteraceae bacterium]|nr:sensor histidine kinase [Steroidobacteraceae bacterium]
MGARTHPLSPAAIPAGGGPDPLPVPNGGEPAREPARRAHLRDGLLVAIVTLATWVLCGHFNVTEMLRRLTAPYERYQFDELPSVLLMLGLGLTWFATRRYGEARQEIARRKSAEARLAAALADNRRLAQQYVELQERERKALARELHDELGQYLNVIKLDAVGIRDDQRASAPTMRYRASTIVENCNHIHGALATLMRELRPTGLDELGLAAALEHCVETWRARLPGVSLQLAITGDFTALPESITVTLFRLVQEALTNVAKHAAARHVKIRLERRESRRADLERIDLAIVDDGVGAVPGLPTRGLGLIGMRERVMALQGSLAFTSSPGQGFALSARIPVPPPPADAT